MPVLRACAQDFQIIIESNSRDAIVLFVMRIEQIVKRCRYMGRFLAQCYFALG
jgi:hypothetical protein